MQKDLHKFLLTAIAVLLIVIMCILILRDVGLAERIQEQVWVLCDPESYVTLRSGPGKKKPEFGGLLCGAEMWTDNIRKNGFLHVMELPAEETEGWISARYIVYDRPVEVNRKHVIRADGRVACRKWVGGKVTGWIYDGDQLTVWWMSDSWAVTSRGYIQSKFIGEVVPDDPELPGMREGFEILWPHLWAYKRSGQFLCSWGCLRESERKGVEKVSRRAKVPEEVKKAAIEAAISGGDPFEELRPYSDNPSKLWHHMKTQLKESDPETYAKIPDLRFRKKEMLHMAPVPDPVVNIDIPEADDLDNCMVTAINVQPYGEFYHDVHHNCIDWRAPDGDEMTMDLVGWKNLSRDLPKILKKLGVVL